MAKVTISHTNVCYGVKDCEGSENPLKKIKHIPMFLHPELSGGITTLTVRNTRRLQTFVQQWTP